MTKNKKIENKKTKKLKRNLILSTMALAISCILLGISYAWFCQQRDMDTVAWIKTPIVLNIGSGDDHDIAYLDMGDIDVESSTTNYKDYVICVYGSPVDNYSLQLAYTTNIAFHYNVYRADKDDTGSIINKYKDAEECYKIRTDYTYPVINGLSMNEIKEKGESPARYQSHKLSYGDDKGENVVDTGKVQGYNEPLYFLAKEKDGVSVMKPLNVGTAKDGKAYFLDYYIIRVSWKPGEVSNDKETDIVYITASR